ncbi:MAG: hypothetical protein KGV50_06405 [Gammaproteobacteria bacterium]|nr:hypothetical protein [Gammaproteobacteria bacterium]
MEIVIFFIASLLLPWLFGTVISLACLKRRYGYFAFALGSGFIIGLPLLSLIEKSAKIIFPDINNLYLLGAGIVIVGFIAYLMPAKRCTIEEQRLERAPSNFSYFMVITIAVTLLMRFIFMYAGDIDFSSSFAAQPLVTNIYIPLAALVTKFDLSNWLQQSVFAYNDFVIWGVSIKPMPFVMLIIALGLIMFGGLRYLGCKLLPSALASYMMLSMPIVGKYLEAQSIHVIMLSALYLLVFMFLVNGVARAEKKLLLLLIVVLGLLSGHSYLLFVSIITVLIVMVCRHISVIASFILILFFIVIGLWQLMQHNAFDTSDVIGFQQFTRIIYDTIFVADDWHLLGLATIISLLVFLFSKRRYDEPQIALCLVAAFYSLLMVLGFIYYSSQLGIISDTFIQQSVFLVAPILSLIPVLVYQLITIENDGIPTI